MPKHILVYGTLRQQSDKNWNYGRFGPQNKVGELWLNGYQLFNLGSYPAAFPGLGQIFCEIHEVMGKTYEMITDMEKGAGYDVHEHEVEVHGAKVKAFMYAMSQAAFHRYRTITRIASGDWNDREAIG